MNFGIGETTKTVTVPVKGDLTDEFDETFFVNLTEEQNAVIADGQGLGTILDNDPEPTLTVSDATVTEPTSGTAPADVVLTLSRASAKPITVTFATANGTRHFRGLRRPGPPPQPRSRQEQPPRRCRSTSRPTPSMNRIRTCS